MMDRQKLEEAKVVLERFKESFDGMPMYGKTLEAFVTAIECIDKALSQPETKHGHWEFKTVEDKDDPAGIFSRRFYCTACGKWNTYGTTNYCPNCGANMDGNIQSSTGIVQAYNGGLCKRRTDE